jgi:hypothetical protein
LRALGVPQNLVHPAGRVAIRIRKKVRVDVQRQRDGAVAEPLADRRHVIAGREYPRSFSGFTGQAEAVTLLRTRPRRPTLWLIDEIDAVACSASYTVHSLINARVRGLAGAGGSTDLRELIMYVVDATRPSPSPATF